jgi:hypothetical protein
LSNTGGCVAIIVLIEKYYDEVQDTILMKLNEKEQGKYSTHFFPLSHTLPNNCNLVFCSEEHIYNREALY